MFLFFLINFTPMDNNDLIKKINDIQERPFIPFEGMEDSVFMKEGMPIHPLTCGNDSRHKVLRATEENGKVILVCDDCDYKQSYIPNF